MATQSNETKIQIADEVIVLVGEDLIAFENDRAAAIAYKEALKSESDQKEAIERAAKEAAKAKLAALGLTNEDLKAMGL